MIVVQIGKREVPNSTYINENVSHSIKILDGAEIMMPLWFCKYRA